MSDIFRPLFRSVEDKVANRREQLRKAQKTFRDRRDQYLRTLEKTVKRLQTNEARLQSEVDRFERELSVTKNRLAEREAKLHEIQQSLSSGAHVGNGLGNFAFPWEPYAANAYLSPSNDSASGGAESFVSSTTTLVWIESKDDQPVQMHVQRKDDFQDHSRGITEMTDSYSSPITSMAGINVTTYVSQLDAVIVAMEFVLKLESPCLPHLRNADDSSSTTTSASAKDSPHGHIHTASAALLCCSPSPSPLTLSASPSNFSPPNFSPSNFSSNFSPTSSSAAVSWPAHRSTLDRLLDISEDLPLDQTSELTPVQVWYCIAQTPTFNRLQVGTLNRASDRLLAHVKCYGFGAVVRRDFLTKLLAELFS